MQILHELVHNVCNYINTWNNHILKSLTINLLFKGSFMNERVCLDHWSPHQCFIYIITWGTLGLPPLSYIYTNIYQDPFHMKFPWNVTQGKWYWITWPLDNWHDTVLTPHRPSKGDWNFWHENLYQGVCLHFSLPTTPPSTAEALVTDIKCFTQLKPLILQWCNLPKAWRPIKHLESFPTRLPFLFFIFLRSVQSFKCIWK